MSAVNRISKYNLEARTRELSLQGKSTQGKPTKVNSIRDIANILTKESGHKISKDSVWSFLRTDVVNKAAVIEVKTELQVKAAEIEINVLEKRQEVINGLLDIANDKENDARTRIKAYEAAKEALWSLDERLQVLTPKGPTFNMNNLNVTNNARDLSDAELLRIINGE